jgi:hypothetical protein
MNWFNRNRLLGVLLAIAGICTLGVAWFGLSTKSDWDDAAIRLKQTMAELNRLERLAPYPSEENLRRMKKDADDYASALALLKDELKAKILPLAPMAPNEFQTRLRRAMTAVEEQARANNIRLPDKFYLGFDDFASALPSESAAPLLGQELAQVEWLLATLLEARVEALTSFRRISLPDEHGMSAPAFSSTSRKSGAIDPVGPQLVERRVVEATFVSSPAAARKVLNQITQTSQQFFIIRLLHIRNERDKGPLRDVGAEKVDVVTLPSSEPAGSAGAKPHTTAALNFIVGNERIETSARIEMVRFTF